MTELDVWRRCECVGRMERSGHDAEVAGVWFERLIEYENHPPPAGAYADTPDTGEPPPDLPSQATDWWHERPRGGGTSRRERSFSTVRQVHDAHIGRKQLPVVLEDGWLRVPTFGGYVTKSHDLVVVRRKKQVIFECAFDDVSCLTVEANGVALSTSVVVECSRRRIPIAVCHVSGGLVARVLPARSPLDTSVVHRQLEARTGPSGTPLAREIIAAKLANQRALLLYHGKYRRRDATVRSRLIEAGSAIREHLQQIERLAAGRATGDVRQDLFLAEARAAAHYWEAFSALVPTSLKFRRRVHRGAADVVNIVLNYGYTHLLHRVWLAVHRAGLEPSLGLVHTGRRRSAGLVFDLMEPYRQPVVDKTILGLLGRGAKLELNAEGDLTLRTRALLQRALARRLTRARVGSRSLLLQIHRGTIAFRRALVDGRPYEAYRMTW